MLIEVCAILYVLVLNLGYLEACNGYTYTLNSFKQCNDESVIKMVPYGLNWTLYSDCSVVISGCMNITKSFTTAKVRYYVKKEPFPLLRGEANFCEAVDQSQIPTFLQTLRILGLSKCPLPAKYACAVPNNKINMEQFKNQLRLVAGTTAVKLVIIHDVGETCVEFNFTIALDKSRNT